MTFNLFAYYKFTKFILISMAKIYIIFRKCCFKIKFFDNKALIIMVILNVFATFTKLEINSIAFYCSAKAEIALTFCTCVNKINQQWMKNESLNIFDKLSFHLLNCNCFECFKKLRTKWKAILSLNFNFAI